MRLHKDISKLHLNHYLEFVYISPTVLTTKLGSLNNILHIAYEFLILDSAHNYTVSYLSDEVHTMKNAEHYYSWSLSFFARVPPTSIGRQLFLESVYLGGDIRKI